MGSKAVLSPGRARVLRWYFAHSLLLTAGCTAIPETISNPLASPPTALVSAAELKLRTALEARADAYAPLDLQSARDNLAAARQAMATGEYHRARRLAEVAYVEAELAEAKADAEITRVAADTLRQRSDALRQEVERRVTGRGSPSTRVD